MHFGEYELSPSLIGLSPLPTGHPKTFQRQPVRSSTLCYQSFNLPMGDHKVSRLILLTIRPIQTRFRSASAPEVLKLASKINS